MGSSGGRGDLQRTQGTIRPDALLLFRLRLDA